MSFEKITVVADGAIYDEWSSITVTAEYGSPVTLIDLETTEVMENAAEFSPFLKWKFPPGTIMSVYASDTPLAVAVVDIYRPSGWPNAHKVAVRARGPAKIGVDSSVDARNLPGEFHNIPYCELVRRLWGSIRGGMLNPPIGCDPSLESELIRYYQLRQGATPYAETMRLAPLAGAQVKPELATGGIKMENGETITHSGGYVVQGVNIESQAAEISAYPRMYEVEAIGQDPIDPSVEMLEIKAIETDGGAPPGTYRRHIVQGWPTPSNVRNYAKWARALNFREAVKARIQVPGWRVMHPDSNDHLVPLSQLWECGTLVTVYSKWLKINCDMFIAGVEFHQDSKSGTTTTLKLTDPRAAGTAASAFTRCNDAASIWSWD